MPFAKLIGLALLAACGVLGGVLLTRFERAKCLQTEAFVDLIRNVRLQIDCFSTPLGNILASLDDKLYAALGAPRAADLSTLLSQTVLLVDRDIAKYLWDFAAALGSGYREEELRYCDHYLALLTPLAQKARNELEKRIKLAFILPPSLSAALILLLW